MSVVRHGLTRAGRYLVLRTRVPDRPGGLVKLLELVAAERGNIVEVNHRREGFGLDVAETGVELTIITRNEEHCRELVAALEQHGYRVESVNRRSAGTSRRRRRTSRRRPVTLRGHRIPRARAATRRSPLVARCRRP